MGTACGAVFGLLALGIATGSKRGNVAVQGLVFGAWVALASLFR